MIDITKITYMINNNIVKLHYDFEIYDYFKEVDLASQIQVNSIANIYTYNKTNMSIDNLKNILEKDFNVRFSSLIRLEQYLLACGKRKDYYRPPYTNFMYFYVLTKRTLDRKYQYLISYVDEIHNASIKSCVYCIESGDYIKIGQTSNLKNRLSGYFTDNPVASLKFVIPCPENKLKELEKELHDWLNDNRYRGEWFTYEADVLIESLIEISS